MCHSFSTQIPNQPLFYNMNKNQEHREKVILEVLSSEKSYNESVQKCLQFIIIPLQAKISSGLFRTETNFDDLFEKYKEIYQLSSNFVNKMNEYMRSGQKNLSVLYVFSTFKEDVAKKYFDYIKTYHEKSPFLKTERQNNPFFNQFVTEQETNLKDTFQSFLILPIQRPPRYRLLLQEIIKYSDPMSVDLPGLQEILQTICDAISAVDQKIEELEEAIKFEKLQSQISDFDVNRLGRHLFFEGDVIKFSRKTRENRHLVLFTDCLLVAEPSLVFRGLKVNKISSTGDYNLDNVDDYPPFVNSIDVRQKSKSFRVNMASPKEKDEILKGFNKMLEANKLTHEELELKLFAPVWIPDSLAPNCMVCGAKFTMFFRKHHCRYCGKCVCKNCFGKTMIIPGLGDEEKELCNPCYEHILSLKLNNQGASKQEISQLIRKTTPVAMSVSSSHDNLSNSPQQPPSPVATPTIKESNDDYYPENPFD